MPVAIAAGGFIELADAFAALAAALLIGTLVVASINWVAGIVGNIPVIGGAIAGMLHSLANAINGALQQLGWLKDQAIDTALNAWNFLVGGTVSALFGAYLWWVQDWASKSGPVGAVLYWWNAVWTAALIVLPARVSAVGGDLAGLHNWIDHVQDPIIQGIGNDLAGLRDWIDRALLPTVAGIGNDLAGLHNWIDHVQMPTVEGWVRGLQDALGRVDADVQTRARAADLSAALREIDRLNAALAALAPLAILANLGEEALTNLKDDALDPCRCLDLSGLASLESRVSALEVEE